MRGNWAFIGGGSALLLAGLYAVRSELPGNAADSSEPPQLEATASAAGADVAGLTAALAEQEAESARLRTTLAVRDSVLQSLQATVAERDTALAEARAALAASDARVRELEARIAELEARPAAAPTLAVLDAATSAGAVRLQAASTDPADLDAIFTAKAEAAVAPWAPPAGTTSVQVQFDFASARLTPGGQAHASAAALAFADMPLARVRVVGHTDTVGSPAANRRLAVKRARAVADALIAAGLPAALIETDGLGESDPPVATGDGVAEPLNRSVAIIAELQPLS